MQGEENRQFQGKSLDAEEVKLWMQGRGGGVTLDARADKFTDTREG